MEEEELMELRRAVEMPGSEQSTGFGLANVNKRIKLNYGNQYGLDIQSKKGEGTVITIKIPVRLVTV
jgi:two-component system sensor histidine kinase YesM